MFVYHTASAQSFTPVNTVSPFTHHLPRKLFCESSHTPTAQQITSRCLRRFSSEGKGAIQIHGSPILCAGARSERKLPRMGRKLWSWTM
ncbi:hypothetical protein HHUSO_G15852 [Huso huso]|uniref:Uncharacterized protein n=1 Tax=Huso huso TaxID=61971 RepID=A0ABR0ZD65_HUSHU